MSLLTFISCGSFGGSSNSKPMPINTVENVEPIVIKIPNLDETLSPKTLGTTIFKGNMYIGMKAQDKGIIMNNGEIKSHAKLGMLADGSISMYSHGMSTTDINEHLDDIYGTTFSSSQISRITDKILDEASDWKNREFKYSI